MLVKESKEKYDPVFASFGMNVLSHDYAESVRRHNLEVNPSRIRTWIPQAGFQENVLRNDADILIIGGRRGGGKMQPLHSKVLTPCGWTTMGELRLGSEVINPTDGRTQRVTRITDHRDKPIYSVLFSDGTRAECGLEHLWLIYRRNGSGLLRSGVMDLEHILPILSEGTEDMFIPLCSAVEFAPSPRVLAPYPTGKRIALEGAELTEEMLLSSIHDRTAILQGICDRIGALDANGDVHLHLKEDTYRERIMFLCRSLGIMVMETTGRDSRHLVLRCHEPRRLFMAEHRNKNGSQAPHRRMKRIVSAEYMGNMDARCIEVDGVSPLYITDGFTVTHNSTVMLLAPARNIDNPNFSCIIFRKEESEIRAGLLKESKKIYSRIGRLREVEMEWVFNSGATIRFEHLQDESKVADRFRGINIPMVLIDEIQLLRYQTIFDLLASNRNSDGIRCQFIGSCNPVDADHWLMQLVGWYINGEGDVIPERNGRKRYFYKYGEDIRDIYWGDSKEEVYAKARDEIDRVLDRSTKEAGLSWENMINSLCFIEGLYSENKIFIKNDPNYVGNLIQQGGEKAIKDFTGKWGRSGGVGNCEISAEDFMKLRTNPEMRTGVHYAVADVALSNNEFIIGAFDGGCLYDVECMVGVGSETAAARVREFLRRHHVHERNFAFDSDGIGQYLKEPFHSDKGGAYAFNNNSASSDRQIWYNLKSECIDRMILDIREGRLSVTAEVWEKRMPDGSTFGEHLMRQRKVLIKKVNTTKNQYISKPEMKSILGGRRSPDEMDMLMMSRIFTIYKPKGNYQGLNLLRL